MKTVPYELKSRPGTIVNVPEDAIEEAETITHLVFDGHEYIERAVSQHECLRESYSDILGMLIKSLHTESDSSESLLLQDHIYLGVCLFQNLKQSQNSRGTYQDSMMTESLRNAIGGLETLAV
ncbi:hypothetical protein GOV12_03855 [Candidatus Pacearchaeota archaeon]|nr:hypothetical protein [Candidatus Pacearchaeota archaeon]